MNTTLLVTWLIRYAHVVGGAIWVGGYLVLAFLMVPALAKQKNETLESLSHLAVRVLTYTGTATIGFGLLLVPRTRGFDSLLRGEWGFIVISCIIIAVVLLGLGDSGLRPALRHLSETGEVKPARRLALIGFGLTVLAIGLMTRALYASS